MGNPITDKIKLGTIGETYAQLRLLELDVQASFPLKDSGNDLIAIKGDICKYLQVKTTEHNRISKPNSKTVYDYLIIVKKNKGMNITDDKPKLYILSKEDVEKHYHGLKTIDKKYNFDQRVVEIWK